MIPLYRDEVFVFRFADARLIPRIHLDGVPAGERVAVHRLDPATGRPGERIAEAVAGPGGWVDLPAPVAVRPGDGLAVGPVGPPINGSPGGPGGTPAGPAAPTQERGR